MLFSGNKKKIVDQPKPRSTLGFLFNPEIGNSVRPLGQNISMFVRLIAMVFASNGLFPRTHPALSGRNTDASLSLGLILSTAWSNLRFTREGLPQVLFFFAAVGSIVVSALMIIFGLFSLATTNAHAASLFTAPGGNGTNCGGTPMTCDDSQDLAITWINYLFLGYHQPTVVNVSNGSGADIPQVINQSTSLQSALYAALAIYSNGVLVIASFLLLYHLVGMVVETAHHGQAMGKRASQIWAPLRLVAALGLLVPVTASGLNTGQYIVIQTAKWGTGLASNIWQTSLVALSNNSFTFRTPTVPGGTDKVVADLIRMNGCRMAWNAIIKSPSGGYMTPFDNTWDVTEFTSGTLTNPGCVDTDALGYSYGAAGPACTITLPPDRHNFGSSHNQELCGYYDQPPAPSGGYLSPATATLATAMWNAHKAAITAVTPDINQAAVRVYNYIPGRTPAEIAAAFASVGGEQAPVDVVEKYNRTLLASITAAAGGWSSSLNSIANTWALQGWVTAGAWFNTIARTQGAVLDAAESPLPNTHGPLLEMPRGDEDAWFGRGTRNRQMNTVYDSLKTVNAAFAAQVLRALPDSRPIDPDINGANNGGAALNAAAAGTSQAAMVNSDRRDTRFFLSIVDWIGQKVGAWGQGDGFQTQYRMGTTANPLAELAYMGNKNVQFGLALIVYGGAGSAVSGILGAIPTPFTQAAAAGGTAVSSLIMMIGGLFLAVGFTLAFIIPLLPFIRFFFNVMTWILTLFEAVVAAPLLALAHVTPHGDGLPGDMARGGYFLILSVFLRPVLMVFGLLAGFLIFMVAISFLNSTYQIAVASSGIQNGSLAVLSKIVYSVMYVVLCYICANTAFKAISYFPEHGMNWLGQRGAEGRGMGDQNVMSGAMAAVGGYMGTRGMSGVTNAMGGPGNVLGKYRQTASANKADQNAEELRQAQLGYFKNGGAGAAPGGGGTGANNPAAPVNLGGPAANGLMQQASDAASKVGSQAAAGGESAPSAKSGNAAQMPGGGNLPGGDKLGLGKESGTIDDPNQPKMI